MNTSGMVVEVSMGANDVGPTQDTPIVSSQATSPEGTVFILNYNFNHNFCIVSTTNKK